MAECNHQWQLRPNGKKEGCLLCGAARTYDPNRCDHEWVLRPSGNKEGCIKCGAARVALDVQDIKKSQAADSPL